MALLDSGANHCFLGERITQLFNLHLEMNAKLDFCLVDGEQEACLGVASKVQVAFAARLILCWDFCIIPLAMDLLLSLPWLR